MKKLWTVVLAVVPPIVGALGPLLWFRRQTRRKAAAARPKIEAMLDEMILIVKGHSGSLDDLIGMNEVRTLNDELRDRDLSLHVGSESYYLDVSIRLDAKKAGHVSVSIRRQCGENVVRICWPDIAEYWPPETWLTDRLERLDALAGSASRLRRVRGTLSRLGLKNDDDGGTTGTN